MFVKRALGYLFSCGFATGILAVDLHILTTSEVATPRIRRLLEEQLGGQVSIGKVDLQEVGVFRCWNLRLRPPFSISAEDEVRCESLQIEYRGSLPGAIQPTRVAVSGLYANVSRETASYWIRRLSPKSDDASPLVLPVIHIDHAQLATDIPEVLAAGNRLTLGDVRISIHPLDGSDCLADIRIGDLMGGAWTGQVRYRAAAETVELNAGCTEFDVREPLARRLQPPLFKLWDKYHVEGPVRVAGRALLHVPRRGEVRVEDWGVRLSLLRQGTREVTGCFRPFPCPVRALEGELELLPAGVRIHGIRGRLGEADLFIRATSSGYPAESAVDVNVRLDRLRLDDAIRDAAPAEFRSLWRELSLAGTADLQLNVTREEGVAKPERFFATVHATDASIRHEAFPYTIEHIQGEVFYNDGEVVLRHLEGTHGDARVHLLGRLAALDRPAGVDLNIVATDVPLDESLHAALPADVKPVWDTLTPTGKVDVTWKLAVPPGPKAETRHRVEVHCRGTGIVFREFPLPLQDLKGLAVFDGPVLDLQFIKGRYRDAPVSVRGSVRWTGQSSDVRLGINVEGLPVDAQFRAEIPEESRKLVDQLGLGGRVDADVRLAYQREAAQALHGAYTAEIHLHDASLEDQFPIGHLHGRVNLEGELRPEGNTAAGVFKLASARFAEKTVTDLGAFFRMSGDRLHFFDVQGTAYDGLVHIPFFEANGATGHYEGRGRVDNVDLGLFARDTFIGGRPLAGRLSGEVDFGGTTGNLASLKGRGRLQVSNGNLWEVPLFLQLVRVLNLGPLPAQESFNSGDVRFRIAEQRVWVDEFLFQSPSVSLSGAGWIKFDGKMDLLIDTEFSTAILSEIPGLRELIDLLKRNIVAVRARGTFRNPDLRLKAFPFKDLKSEPDDDTK